MRRTTTLVTAFLLVMLSLTACSNDSGSSTGSGGTGKGTTIDITIKNGKVTPHGDRVKAKVGQPIDQPGIVDVEDHALEQVIVQLEVS